MGGFPAEAGFLAKPFLPANSSERSESSKCHTHASEVLEGRRGVIDSGTPPKEEICPHRFIDHQHRKDLLELFLTTTAALPISSQDPECLLTRLQRPRSPPRETTPALPPAANNTTDDQLKASSRSSTWRPRAG